MNKFNLIILTFLLFVAYSNSIAQSDKTVNPFILDKDSNGYNDMSVHPIHKSDIFWQMVVYREIDLNEKPNKPFAASQEEFVKFILEAVKKGDSRLTVYVNDSCLTEKTETDIKKALYEDFGDEGSDNSGSGDDFFSDDAGGDDFGTDAEANADPFGGGETQQMGPVERLPRAFRFIQFKEYVIFDKHRSRMYHDIQSIGIYYLHPIKKTKEHLGWFRYTDIVKLFDDMPQVKWYNRYNRAADMKISNAFDLRLFHSRIDRVSNPDGQTFDLDPKYNAFGPQKVAWASRLWENKLIDKEVEMWSY